MAPKPVLLLLPGLLCDSAAWEAQIDGLADICVPRVIEFGDADSIEAMANIALAAAPERFALAGHSMGGRVAQQVYRLAPERVLRLALLGTDFRGPIGEADRDTETVRRDGMLARARVEGIEAFARDWARQVVSPARAGDARLISTIAGMMSRHSSAQLAAQTLAGLTRPDFTALLPRISCATLLMAGADDRLRPVDVHREIASVIPRNKLVVVEHCGHMIAMEDPNTTTAAMRSWLQEQNG